MHWRPDFSWFNLVLYLIYISDLLSESRLQLQQNTLWSWSFFLRCGRILNFIGVSKNSDYYMWISGGIWGPWMRTCWSLWRQTSWSLVCRCGGHQQLTRKYLVPDPPHPQHFTLQCCGIWFWWVTHAAGTPARAHGYRLNDRKAEDNERPGCLTCRGPLWP